MVCGQIHAPATLSNYVHMYLMNTKFLASLWSSKLRMFIFVLCNWPLSFLSEETFSHVMLFVTVLCQQIPMRSLIHSAKRCCYRNSICDGVLRLRIFLLCIPLFTTTPPAHCKELRHFVTDILDCSWSCSQTRDTLYVYGRRIY